jgi:hypothetical protein
MPKNQRKLRLTAKPRSEPDLERIAKALIALSLQGEQFDEASDAQRQQSPSNKPGEAGR